MFLCLQLSKAARSLWGKSDYDERRAWLPLFVHMIDSSYVAQRLWEDWLPISTKEMLSRTLGTDNATSKAFFVFICAAHDIGKATPAFQGQPCSWSVDGDKVSLAWIPEGAGLNFAAGSRDVRSPKHAVAGQAIIEKIMQDSFGVKMRNARSVSSIVGCHHGKPPTRFDVRHAKEETPAAMGFDDDAWLAAQKELFSLSLNLAGLTSENLIALVREVVAPQAASILSGMLIMCDWIASNAYAFPLIPLESVDWEYLLDGGEYESGAILNCGNEGFDLRTFYERGKRGWERTGLFPSWSKEPLPAVEAVALYKQRFTLPEGATLRAIQREALSLAQSIDEPGLMIIEAPMGEGKTEAALAVAEVFAAKVGAGGVCVALPTMATTDAMFSRVHSWLDHLLSSDNARPGTVYLAHGKARLNEEYEGIVRESRYRKGDMDHGGDKGLSVEVSDWMFGSKKGMLSSFVVCTVDQVLMGALQMKHLALRQLSLVNKVVVIDECHAYDMYMRQYLDVVLEWLGSWHVPVILLSATLPRTLREEMANSYLSGWATDGSSSVPSATNCEISYPLITYTDGLDIRQKDVRASGRSSRVEAQLMSDDVEALVALMKERLGQGGCAGVICDTVTRAQEVARVLGDEFGAQNVTLVHARFTDLDRMQNELRLREMFGPDSTTENGKRPKLHIVVGTQVLEQSLDIDFDLLVSDIAPVDLIFQRLGRCHRHARASRPAGLYEARCYIRGISEWKNGVPIFSKGLTTIYEKASLLESMSVCRLFSLTSAVSLTLPADISKLVQLAYGDEAGSAISNCWGETYRAACSRRENNCREKRLRAQHCLLKSVREMTMNQESLTDWYSVSSLRASGEDYGPRAVRDTQETVEVILLLKKHGSINLLPWVGQPDKGVEFGASVPVDEVPDSRVAKIAAQSSVRLPPSLCRPDWVEEVIDALEQIGAPFVGAWQESPWLQGRLVLPLQEMNSVLEARITLGMGKGWTISYTRDAGLMATVDEEEPCDD
ncbi:CRISPR-associated helicase Cas3' [Paratractidigestivibacter sp.]|uniref:CRISPR-associated helicase Cas3' n=1 Tax=Paratractidigestivibacter sp. TaxID=2847316 RepID=UPI002ACB06E5|nr:CRISPR-associated helicase Cas3' [Paratractidigestivibacter sp.]